MPKIYIFVGKVKSSGCKIKLSKSRRSPLRQSPQTSVYPSSGLAEAEVPSKRA